MLRSLASSRFWPLATVLVLAACGGGESPANPDPEPEPDPNEVDSSGGTVTAQGGAVTLAIPAGAVSSNVTISVTPASDPAGDPNTLPGTVYEFGPDGTQFNQPVTLTLDFDPNSLPSGFPEEAVTIAKFVGGAWEPIDGTISVDPGAGTVSGEITSFSSYAAVVDRCALRELSISQTGSISDADCAYSDEIRTTWEEFFTLDPAALAAEAGFSGSDTPRINVRFESDFDHLIGFQEAGQGNDGLVYRFRQTDVDAQTGSAISEFSMYAGEDEYRIFMGGDDQSDTGDYTLSFTVEAGGTYDTSRDPGAIAGSATFTSTANASNTYEGEIGVGAAAGEPLFYQYRLARLEAGKAYRYAVSDIAGTGVDAFVSATPIADGVDQELDTGAGDSDRDREIVFQASRSGFYYLEVSASPSAPDASYTLVFEEVSDFDPCATRELSGYQISTLNANDCLYTDATREQYEEIYGFSAASFAASVGGPSGTALFDFNMNAGFEGIYGIKRPGDGGLVLGSRLFDANVDRRMFILADGGDYEIFVGGDDTSQTGTYTLRAEARAVGDYFCGTGFIATPLTFSGTIRDDTACTGTITFGPFVGDALLYQYAYAKLEAGTTYRFTVTGYDPDSPFGFFSQGLSEDDSSVLLLPDAGQTTLTREVTPTVDGYWYIEWSLGGDNPPVDGYTFTFERVN